MFDINGFYQKLNINSNFFINREMTYILALDQGTTSSKALIVDAKGNVVGTAQKEFHQFFPMPGWVEHDPLEIWQSQLAVAREVIQNSNISINSIAAIGITNQRETTVVWERSTGKPIYNCIVWQDRRTSHLCEQLKNQGLEELINNKTGLLLDPYFSGTKLNWILNNVQGAKERASKGDLAFGTIDTWLTWNLSNGTSHVTDVTNASRTLLFNISTGSWDDDLLQIFEIPRCLLPQVHYSSHHFGSSAQSLFGRSIPITGIAGDQQAALFGQACHNAGQSKTTYGTGCFMLMHTGDNLIRSKHRLLTTMACQLSNKKQYALEGSVFMGGAIVQWLRDALHLVKKSSEIEELATSVPDSDGVYFVPAFTGLGAPYWNPKTRGTILGISRGTTSGHIARAALEAIAFQVADVLKAMQSDSNISLNELKVDGGVSVNNLLMQFQSDLIQVPVIRTQVSEITALGVAYLAGLHVGMWGSLEELKTLWALDRKFNPNPIDNTITQQMKAWSKAVQCAQSWEAIE